jgi:hypothetical protein
LYARLAPRTVEDTGQMRHTVGEASLSIFDDDVTENGQLRGRVR